MSLPGKLCVGILEEDNPQKAYFRFKPLLVEVDERYVPYTEAQIYPEDGCIRIVPDKNESYHFKSRMRGMGLFCVVDLRAHPDDNDKIRPNKNYREGSPEQNAFIIYSDVIREPAPETIFEILPEVAADAPRPQPRTAAVLLQGESLNHERFEWIADPDAEGSAKLLPTGKRCAPDSIQIFDLKGFRGEPLSFAIAAPKTQAQIFSGKSQSIEEPASEDKPSDPAPTAVDRPIAIEKTAVATSAGDASPAPTDKPVHREGDAGREPLAQTAEKPWIHHDSSMLPKPIDPRLSPSQRSLAAQSGMNPRRGRSLQELIEEKWQHSRLNQLGQPVAPIHTGAPLASPVEHAVDAVRDAWNQPQLRRDLLESLSGIEEFGASLEECREAAKKLDIERHLEGLEARRLALLGELDHLTLRNAETRQALKQELRDDVAGELADAVKRAKDAQAQQARFEQQAEEARAAAQDARKAVDALTGEALEQRLREFALNQHMLERIRLIRGEAESVPAPAPEIQPSSLNALAQRVATRFEAAGYGALDREEALNLCACAALSSALILSGPVGSGKTETARLLAEALGWADIDRCAVFAPGKSSLEGDVRVSALDKYPETPALLLLDDANLYPVPDALRGLGALDRPQWRLCLTVQDGGCPLPPYALDRGFTIRLASKSDAPWRPRAKKTFAPQAPASLCLAIPDKPLPAAIEARMDALREALSRLGTALSHRALSDSWRYCALMLDALGEDADPMRILDRAVAQRLLPSLLASASLDALRQLPALLEGLPESRALLRQPLPIQL